MVRKLFAATAAAFFVMTGLAAAQGQPPFMTIKVDGTDNVYIFRYQGYQSMFIVTPAGVIATDPAGLRRPQAVKTYIEEIQKITKAPIKYVIYSHSHFDHAAGGKPFKDLGATFIAHKNAKARIVATKNPDVVVPDQTVDQKKTVKLGGTTLELNYVGKNHSDGSLVMRLPKEKIIFVVDFMPLQGVQFRDMQDNYLPDLEKSAKKVLDMDWDRLIPGHPGAGGRAIGTKDDARVSLQYLQDLSAAVKQAVERGQVLRHGHERLEAAEIRELCRLWQLPARQHRALLRVLEPRDLIAFSRNLCRMSGWRWKRRASRVSRSAVSAAG